MAGLPPSFHVLDDKENRDPNVRGRARSQNSGVVQCAHSPSSAAASAFVTPTHAASTRRVNLNGATATALGASLYKSQANTAAAAAAAARKPLKDITPEAYRRHIPDRPTATPEHHDDDDDDERKHGIDVFDDTPVAAATKKQAHAAGAAAAKRIASKYKPVVSARMLR